MGLVNGIHGILVHPDGEKYGGNQTYDRNHQKYGLNSLPHVCVDLNCPFDKLRGCPLRRDRNLSFVEVKTKHNGLHTKQTSLYYSVPFLIPGYESRLLCGYCTYADLAGNTVAHRPPKLVEAP